MSQAIAARRYAATAAERDSRHSNLYRHDAAAGRVARGHVESALFASKGQPVTGVVQSQRLRPASGRGKHPLAQEQPARRR